MDLREEHLARISHELRTPLAGLRMWVEVLRSGRPDDRGAAIDAIDRCARAQSRLIEDLLDLARGESGKLRVAEEIVDPRHPLEEAVAVMRPEAEARGLCISTALERGAGLVRGDAGRIEQVAWNLLSNSVKFTPAGGRIDVALRGEPAEVVFTVEDTGTGLDQAARASLFTPFQSTGGPAGGLGLGLPISRQLVELHGGTIHGDNRIDGPGARFTVRLPRALEARCLPSPLPAPSAADQPLRGLRVLLVEDHEPTRHGVASVLSTFGAHVTSTEAAESAFDALRQRPHDVILSDIAMPDEDGCAFLGRVRAIDGDDGRIPAIALTALARPEDAARALTSGFQRILIKPIDPIDLVEMLTSIAEARRPSGVSPFPSAPE